MAKRGFYIMKKGEKSSRLRAGWFLTFHNHSNALIDRTVYSFSFCLSKTKISMQIFLK